MSLRSTAASLAAAYAALAALVATGALTGMDQWAIDHVMPDVGLGEGPTLIEAAVPLLHVSWDSWLRVVTNIVTLPAQSLLSLLVLLALRDLRWLAAWAAGNSIELLCKAVIVRPPLYGPDGHVGAFDSSFPSGHTLRGLLVALALAGVWPRARPFLAAWGAAVLVLLVVGGHHVPSDVAGGAVLAVFVVCLSALAARGRAARALRARGLRAPARRAGRA